MGLILLLILGAIVGWLATRIMHRPEGLLGSTVIGVVGAFIGAFVAHLFNSDTSILNWNLTSFIFALIGACILVAALNYNDRGRVR